MTTKAAATLAIYNELRAAGDPDIRKNVIARCKAELDMGDAGAATYYQNAKRKAEGGEAQPLKAVAPATKPKIEAGAAPDICWSVIQIKDDKVFDCAAFVDEPTARAAYDKLGDHNKPICQVICGTLQVGTAYVMCV